MMRKSYHLITLLLLGMMGFGPSAFGQTTLSSNIPASPLAVSLNTLPDTLVNAPDTLSPVASATGGATPYAYAWGPATSNYQFPGDSSSPILIIGVGDPLTTFSVIVTDDNGCMATATFSVDPTTDASDELERLVSLEVFPNPSQGSFHISLNGEPFSASFDLLIRDQMGRSVYLEHLPKFSGSFERDVELNGLSSGVYFLGLGSGENVVYRKLIIE